jgi:hypothetical protein
MEKIKSPFVYNGNIGCYAAKFPLPDDGTPDTEQYLEVVICVSQEEDDGPSCRVFVCSRGGAVPVTRVLLADNWNAPMRGVSMALYGVARKRTIEVIEPIL